MNAPSPINYTSIYSKFHSPIVSFNCGDKCAPYNEGNVPFCCDIKHTIPSSYQSEWVYLQENSDLWHEWEAKDSSDLLRINLEKPIDQVLLECRGHLECQREYRTITCRAFPFFPYIDRNGAFLGISYYWIYRSRCWIISNLNLVIPEYLREFILTFEYIFEINPNEKENFKYHSMIMRRVFGRQHTEITLLHRNGNFYSVTPKTGKLLPLNPEKLDKFYPYSIINELPFPDEVS